MFFKALNVKFYSNSFTHSCPSVTLWRSNVFHSLSKNYLLALQSFSLAWLSHVKPLKVNLGFFVSSIILKSHR